MIYNRLEIIAFMGSRSAIALNEVLAVLIASFIYKKYPMGQRQKAALSVL
jgi:hypothetical protein